MTITYERRYRENNLQEVIATHRQAAKETDFLYYQLLCIRKAYAKRNDIKLHHPDGSHPSLLGNIWLHIQIFPS